MIIFFLAIILIVIGVVGMLRCGDGSLKWWGYASFWTFFLGFAIIFYSILL